MKIRKKLNPIFWPRKKQISVIIAFYLIAIPLYIYFGFHIATASETEISGNLSIPALSISSGITEVEPNNKNLETPERVVGSYHPNKNKIFLFAHSTTAFRNLKNVQLENEVIYNSKSYIVTKISNQPLEKINMDDLLKESREETLVLMTCSGKEQQDGKFPSRLIVTAVPK